MTKEEMIELARQAGFEEHQAKFDTRFEPFAKLVAAKEREACAKLCEEYFERVMASRIRARGQE
jgi:hypothetical protein